MTNFTSKPLFALRGSIVRDVDVLEAKTLLRPEEASSILNCSLRMIYYHIKTGKLSGIKDTGPLRVTSQSVKRMLTEAQTDPFSLNCDLD